MTNTTTNLELMRITIVGGTYFYTTCCSECSSTNIKSPEEQVIIETPNATVYSFSINRWDFSYIENENNNFKTSSTDCLRPVSNELSPDSLEGRIISYSKKQNEPIEINTTEEGRNKNQRTLSFQINTYTNYINT